MFAAENKINFIYSLHKYIELFIFLCYKRVFLFLWYTKIQQTVNMPLLHGTARVGYQQGMTET